MTAPFLIDALPKLADEIKSLLTTDNLYQLVDQVERLPIIDICGCGQRNCATFYTAPKPDGAYGPGHTNYMLDPDEGMLILDVVDGKIMCVEILDRKGMREKVLNAIANH